MSADRRWRHTIRLRVWERKNASNAGNSAKSRLDFDICISPPEPNSSKTTGVVNKTSEEVSTICAFALPSPDELVS